MEFDAAFARFLRLDVANGDASLDTVRGYRSQLAAWVAWCAEHAVDARTASVEDVKRYREDLVAQGRQPTTIAHKLNVLRRVYAAAVAAGLRADNPATGIRAPRDRRAPEDFGYLSEVELALLFRAVPHDGTLKHLRDRALLGLLGLQALRTIELMRANVDDLQRRGDDWALLVHGKSHDRLVFLRPDVAEALRGYLAARGRVPEDADGGVVGAQAGSHRGGVDAPQDVQLVGDRRRLAATGDQVLAVALHILDTGGPGVDGVLGAPGGPGGELAAVAAHGIERGVAVGHVQAQEAGEGGVQVRERRRDDGRKISSSSNNLRHL